MVILNFPVESVPNDLLPFNNYLYAVMSRQDNVNTVYRCMLRGAVDYLVKPIRMNELRNLWQHVWRRRSVCTSYSMCISDCHHSWLLLTSLNLLAFEVFGRWEGAPRILECRAAKG